jgi:hypothetical protein
MVTMVFPLVLSASEAFQEEPEEYTTFINQTLTGYNAYIEQGLITDIGFFLDGQLDGYVIVEGDAVEILKGNLAFPPYWLTETRESVSFDQVKNLFQSSS